MNLKPEQIERLRKPFDKIGAFGELTDTEVEKLLNELINFYSTLAKINLRIKQAENEGSKKEN